MKFSIYLNRRVFLMENTHSFLELCKEMFIFQEFYQWLANKTEMDYININNIWKVADVLFCEVSIVRGHVNPFTPGFLKKKKSSSIFEFGHVHCCKLGFQSKTKTLNGKQCSGAVGGNSLSKLCTVIELKMKCLKKCENSRKIYRCIQSS